jgi:hypothetical protein
LLTINTHSPISRKRTSRIFPAVGSFHTQRVANLLAERGIQCINIEQDLAIAQLQMSKRIRSVQFFEEIRGPVPRGRLELTPDLLIVG